MTSNPADIALIIIVIVIAGLICLFISRIWRNHKLQRFPESSSTTSHSSHKTQGSSTPSPSGMTKVHFSFELAEGESKSLIAEGLPPANPLPIIETGDTFADVVYVPESGDASLGVFSILKTESDLTEAILAVNSKNASTEAFPIFLREKTSSIGKVALLLAVVAFVILPPALVFLDRWLGVYVITDSLGKIWNSINFFRQLAYPPYFIYIFLCVICIFLLVWRWKGAQLNFIIPDPVSHPGVIPLAPEVWQKNLSRILFWGSGISLFIAFLVEVRLQKTIGWLFLSGMVLFYLGWILRELSIVLIMDVVKRNWKPALSFLIFHFTLVMVFSSYYSDGHLLLLWITLLVISLVFTLYKYYKCIPKILWIMTLALILYVFRINGWEFSVVGDEYSFFMYAQELAKQHNLLFSINKLFDGVAVFGSHPFFSSFLQMISMRLFSGSNFGWRFSNPYLSTLSLGFFYIFFRSFVKPGTALIGILFLAASHYIMTFGKIGYNNLQSYFVLSIVLAAGAWAVCTRYTLAYIALGFSMGACFYVYPAALYALPIALLLLLFYDPPSSREALKRWGTALISLGVLILPLLLQSSYWSAKIPGTIFYTPEIMASSNSLLSHFVTNIIYSFLSFLYIPEESHFVVASYVDPLSAALLILGLAYLVIKGWRVRFIAFFLVGYLAMLLFVGTSHGGTYPPNTRMFLLLPWFALLSAVGVEWLKMHVNDLGGKQVWIGGIIGVILICVFALNIYQAYSLSMQRSTGMQSPAMLFMRVLERIQLHELLDEGPITIWFLTTPPWGIDGYLLFLDTYDVPDDKIQLEKVDIEASQLSEDITEMVQKSDALVIIYPDLDPGLQEALSTKLEEMGKLPCQIKTVNNYTRFILWYSQPMEWVCIDKG